MKSRKKKNIHFMPKTKFGKRSFWLTILGFVLMYFQYWIAMIFNISIHPVIGLISIALITIFGISSIFAIFKYKDKAIALFISALFGLLGILIILGEFFFPH